jgi:opacity protein-like surface antigen
LEIRTTKFIAGAALVAFALAGVTAASAADLPARTYTKAPVYVDPGFNWSGFYLGGNVGYSWGRSSNSETISRLNTGVGLATGTGTNNVDGVIGGGQFGYNWQMSNWLFGLETDIQGSGERGSSFFTCVACANGGTDITSTLTQKLDWFGTARARRPAGDPDPASVRDRRFCLWRSQDRWHRLRNRPGGHCPYDRFPGHVLDPGGLDCRCRR